MIPGAETACLGAMLVALTAVSIVDLRRWEISPGWCLAALASGAAWRMAADGPVAGSALPVLTDMALGGATVLIAVVALRLWRASALGIGDLWLLPTCAAIAGLRQQWAWAILFMLLTIAVALCHARRRNRGRPLLRVLRRSHVPAAPAACGAVALVALLQQPL